ncbi:conserved protein of unknown function [Kyrpidia spormannii]|uniref:Uncharacterized protein n=1 Tax=Kyrpidia spormannii TaxID=2055160 RepID=A0ACA8ZCU6_9BACL|nr:conserved protein of unknown function [Kyrpidia spormannii]
MIHWQRPPLPVEIAGHLSAVRATQPANSAPPSPLPAFAAVRFPPRFLCIRGNGRHRPPQLANGPKTGWYRIAVNGSLPGLRRIEDHRIWLIRNYAMTLVAILARAAVPVRLLILGVRRSSEKTEREIVEGAKPQPGQRRSSPH